MVRILLLGLCALTFIGCDSRRVTQLTGFSGGFVLLSENDDPVPSDPSAPNGCCITTYGHLSLNGTNYLVSSSYTNKNNGLAFTNTERGTFVVTGDTIRFTRVAGEGVGYPFLFAPGTISGNGSLLRLHHGDEGPGSNQIKSIYFRQPQLPD